jgi:hypothetical protein
MNDIRTSARFFDTRAAYTMFVTATDEKARVADRLGDQADQVTIHPPGLRLFDAGMGDASVLSHLMRRLHRQMPHIPWLVVAKEISIEDVRQALAKLPDRLMEHPETVFVVTNMRFSEAPSLGSVDPDMTPVWRDVPLDGNTSLDFTDQIRDMLPTLTTDWQVRTSPVTGNPVYVQPAVVVLYRRDREFLLRSLIPRPDQVDGRYDLIVAAQSYRARTPVERKVSGVLVPLARALAPGGRLVGIHSYGNDPGLEITCGVWPDERPFPHRRAEILAEARRQLAGPEDAALEFPHLSDEESLFSYRLHTMPSDETEHIGTSTLVAAFTAAAYVAQIDEPRLSAAMASGDYLQATRDVIDRHGGVWFNDEMYLITRKG